MVVVQRAQQWLKHLADFLFSWRVVPVLKGTISYVVVLILVFSRAFDHLSPFPVNYMNILVISIVSQPGRPFGVCVQQAGFSLLGVCLGSALFPLLAVLGHAPVAQGFIFAVIVYLLALVKARSLLWYPFSLLAIYNSFNGIYSSLTLDGTLHTDQLVENMIPYLYVNFSICLHIPPRTFSRSQSSERDLRETIVKSLEHIGELSALLGKAYALTGTEEERLRRIALTKIMKDDFGLITLKIEETSIELNWTKYSLQDYRVFVSQVHAIQTEMIACQEALISLEERDFDIFRNHFLSSTQTHFTRLQSDIMNLILDIRLALTGLDPDKLPPPPSDRDVEKQSSSTSSTPSPFPSKGIPTSNPCAANIKNDFEAFRDSQQAVLTELLTTGEFEGILHDQALALNHPGLSVLETYGADVARGRATEHELEGNNLKRRCRVAKEKGPTDEKADERCQAQAAAVRTHWSLIRVCAVISAFERFINSVAELHVAATERRSYGLRLHVFELFHQPLRRFCTPQLPLRQALALCEDHPYQPPTVNHWDWFKRLRQLLGGDESIFAGKTAAAALVFATLLFSDTTRPFFVSYALSSALLTAMVAMGPTLGQAIIFLVLQVLGAVVGSLWGLAVLEMFRNVGGYQFNPYGMTCLLGAFAFPLQFLIYEKPMFFVFSLLAMLGAGVPVVIEWIFVEELGVPDFTIPSLLIARAIAAQCVALVLVVVFQVLVLRTPARRLAREALARIVYANLSYYTLLSAYFRAAVPGDGEITVCGEALDTIRCALQHRERQIQADLIALDPLIMFAITEPEMGYKFPVDAFMKVLAANQSILDRMRDARESVGSTPFPEFIMKNYSSVLSPYRRRATLTTTTAFYLCAASLTSRTPLPHHVPGSEAEVLHDFMHDALVLSRRCARAAEGTYAILSGEFTRCWFHLMCLSAIPLHLKGIELACKEMYGELEDSANLI